MFFRIHDRIQIPRYIETATVLRGTKRKTVSKTQPRKNWHSACVEFGILPRSWLAPWILSSDTNGHPAQLRRQAIQEKKEATGFLRRFGSELIFRRSDCDVWETKEKPKVRALMFQNRDGLYVVGQLRWGNADG